MTSTKRPKNPTWRVFVEVQTLDFVFSVYSFFGFLSFFWSRCKFFRDFWRYSIFLFRLTIFQIPLSTHRPQVIREAPDRSFAHIKVHQWCISILASRVWTQTLSICWDPSRLKQSSGYFGHVFVHVVVVLLLDYVSLSLALVVSSVHSVWFFFRSFSCISYCKG